MSIVAVLLVFHVTNSLAESFIVDGIGYDILSESTVAVTYKPYMEGNIQHRYYYEGDIVIPSTVTYQGKSYTVTSISGGLYASFGAFWGCNNLRSVIIPSTVTSIGAYAFSKCTSLTSIIIPNSVNSIGYNAFSGCISLISISLPSGITSIASDTFADCSSLKTVVIPNSVITIGQDAFYNCTSLTNIVIPESVNHIGSSCFRKCISLQSIYLPSSITSIGDYAFGGCAGLTSIDIPASVTSIGSYAFENCENLKEITIPNSVTMIEKYTFYGCSNLNRVSLPVGLKSIGVCSFSNCMNLQDITIPNSVTIIDKYAFSYCGITGDVLLDDITTLGEGAFYSCKYLIKVAIGDNLSIINSYTFKDCTNLKEVVIGNEGNRNGSLEEIVDLNAFPDQDILNVFINSANVKKINAKAVNYTVHNYTKIYAPLVSPTMLKLWHAFEENTYDISTKQFSEPPHLEWSCTQSTATLDVGPIYDGYRYTLDGSPVSQTHYEFMGLRPSENFNYRFAIWLDQDFHSHSYYFHTSPLEPTIYTWSTPTTISARCSYTEGDANVVGTQFRLANRTIEGNECTITGLNPEVGFNAEYIVTVRYGENNDKTYNYEKTVQIKTKKLTFTTEMPKVTNSGEAIVCASTNISEVETNVGFEWRKIDAPDVVPSRTGESIIYNGAMEGKIKNLDASTYWKVRPFYKSGSNTMYYGEWIGFDPSDFSYFEPTVHTYNSATISENNVILTGMAIEGSDPILEQGFEYWNTASEESLGSRAPANSQQVTAEGQRMQAVLTNLTEGSSYSYRAYVKTEKGFFYGEECSFVSPSNGNDQSTVSFVEVQYSASSDVYDFRGVKVRSNATTLNGLPRGLYIFNGRKVIVR